MGVTSGKRSGPGLKPGLNMADTGSVVNTVTGHRAVSNGGRTTAKTAAGKSSNNMVSANANYRKR